MARIARRTVLRVAAAGLATGAIGAAAIGLGLRSSAGRRLGPSSTVGRLPQLGGDNPTAAENRRPGSKAWSIGADGTKAADNIQLQISGYASDTSVNVGEEIDFRVTAKPGEEYTIAIYRFGHYAGARARLMMTSPVLLGVRQADPITDPATGMITCDWLTSWTLKVPRDWLSGYYLAVFTTASGWRALTPFVVRDDTRRTSILMVTPFATYQAYNQFPMDGRRGKSLYYGYQPLGAPDQLAYAQRAHRVSFDRPYGRSGMPNRADLDHDVISWAEGSGFDLTYASNVDLHTGRVDLAGYRAVVFSGHDEYWSAPMRDALEGAIAKGTSVAFLSANNIYWHVRFDAAGRGPTMAFSCYKTDADPNPDATGATGQWRDPYPGPGRPEQGVLGIQYSGIVKGKVPLVVQSADHWFWAGTGVADGDRIDDVVAGEADSLLAQVARPTDVVQTILSASPFTVTNTGQEKIQNTSLYETRSGAIVFAAGSLTWPYSLSRGRLADPRIQRATANLFLRMMQHAP